MRLKVENIYRPSYDYVKLKTMMRVGPGLGIEVNESLVRAAAAKYKNEIPWRNEVWKGPDGSLREW